MKIISPFKDYYDFLAYQYGVDNSIIYERPSRIFIDELTKDKKEQSAIYNEINHWCSSLYCTMVVKNIKYYFHRCVIFDKQIVYVEQTYPNKEPFFRLLTKEDCFNLVTLAKKVKRGPSYLQETKSTYITGDYVDFHTNSNLLRVFEAWSEGNTSYKVLFSDIVLGDRIGVLTNKANDIYELTRKYKLPIIGGASYDEETRRDYISIPNLSKIQGMSGIFSPHEIYRDLTNFFIRIKDSVDTKPPVEIANEDKIVKAGFDTKTSFRGREFPKKPRKIKRG